MRVREAARVILLDDLGRILLMKIKDTTVVNPANPIPDEFWVTMGGALKGGESFEEAAIREVWEESGIKEFDLGPFVWVRENDLNWKNEMIHSYERYYVARVKAVQAIKIEHLTEQEKRVYQNHKWWSLEELLNSNETFLPPGMTELLPSLIKGEIPKEVIRIER